MSVAREPPALRRNGRPGMLRLCVLHTVKRLRGMALRLKGRETCSGILLRFQVLLGAHDRGLGRVQIRRGGLSGSGRSGGGNRLPRVAHFLHRGFGGATN